MMNILLTGLVAYIQATFVATRVRILVVAPKRILTQCQLIVLENGYSDGARDNCSMSRLYDHVYVVTNSQAQGPQVTIGSVINNSAKLTLNTIIMLIM